MWSRVENQTPANRVKAYSPHHWPTLGDLRKIAGLWHCFELSLGRNEWFDWKWPPLIHIPPSCPSFKLLWNSRKLPNIWQWQRSFEEFCSFHSSTNEDGACRTTFWSPSSFVFIAFLQIYKLRDHITLPLRIFVQSMWMNLSLSGRVCSWKNPKECIISWTTVPTRTQPKPMEITCSPPLGSRPILE